MSQVDHRTGEVIEQLDFDQALELTESIRESVSDLEEKIVAAYFGRAWVALDYPSWDEYVKGEFKGAPLALPREERAWQVASLRSQGLSLRAIASATGVDMHTVDRDLADANASPDRVTGIDGKEYQPVKPAEVLSPEEQERRLREQEDRAAVSRGVYALEQIVTYWPWLENLPDNGFRDEILRGLTDDDRRQIDAIRQQIGDTP